MARMSKTPMQFSEKGRTDSCVSLTSGRAGKVVPVAYVPLLRGDSASGQVSIDIELAEMPRPLLNAVHASVQAWFVPKSAYPKFSGGDEFMNSYMGEDITTLGAAARTPPDYFDTFDTAPDLATLDASELFRTLGIHIPSGAKVNADLIDAYNLVYNFRLAAHSSRLTRRDYAMEDLSTSTSLARAFWPTGRFSSVVPDYEQALVVGSLDLDVAAGQLPIENLWRETVAASGAAAVDPNTGVATSPRALVTDIASGMEPYAEMAGQVVGVTLAAIDKARTTQAFANARTAYAGNDTTGFNNDNAIIATLMQGFAVPEDQLHRPWLLDSKRVPVGFTERFATDAANLDESVSQGQASASLALNVPKSESGGIILITVEVLPERIDERQTDEFLHIEAVTGLPDRIRDEQRDEPVDLVAKRRLDARHTTPDGLYGYEPMNNVWNRQATRLGGDFYQEDPLNPWNQQRSALWMVSLVDPAFTTDHYLAPDAFPHDVFSDSLADAFECTTRHNVSIQGLTLIGDVLEENNDDYDAIENSGT